MIIKFFTCDNKEEIKIEYFFNIINADRNIDELINELKKRNIEEELILALNNYKESQQFDLFDLDIPFYNFLNNKTKQQCLVFALSQGNNIQFYSNIITSSIQETLEEILNDIEYIEDQEVYHTISQKN